ncbi:hypothetical protein L873DRAFT_1824483 [Choiromyces venosus 120613-1]|uniref:Uncharacterized protein n=1 Tax=Choiromyces venosus 120613-1 TaxID=1336337 RepID=A0A3N4ISV2_9PEZI|nr:hypothetical protein L873DRAFT_1824484 [Choiromyces venosus 120613-1]RPA88467.1 hypothetical protein L873DRAFT_1824483 [Choiromyces venosus 120613-1]
MIRNLEVPRQISLTELIRYPPHSRHHITVKLHQPNDAINKSIELSVPQLSAQPNFGVIVKNRHTLP